MRLKVFMVVLALLMAISLLPVPLAHSQDLGSELAAALAANEQAVETIQLAESATSPAVARVLVLQAVSEAQTVRTALRNALALATTDEQRSRIEGLLDHIEAAINAGLQAQTAPDEQILSIAAAVRGELVEAIRELQPFAPEVTPPVTPIQPAPQQLPRAGDGWVDAGLLSLLIASGLGFLLIGLRMRSATRPA